MLPFVLSSFLDNLTSALCCFGFILQAPLSRACCWFKIRLSYLLPLGILLKSDISTNLYVSSYAGTITSLQLNQELDGLFSLKEVAVSVGSQLNHSWLTKDDYNDVIYCVDEGLAAPNGSLASYKVARSGELSQIDQHTVISGPVSSVVYNGGKALALAHYEGSAVTTWRILPSGGISPLEILTFTLSAPGANPGRQLAPHPHEALIDPTDSYVIVPDLGADLVRVFSVDPTTSLLTEATPLKTPPGTGPRHGVFLKTDCDTFFFLVFELGNTVASYKVTYGKKGLGFTKVFERSIYGPNATPTGANAAEVVISPDRRYLLTSSRNDSLFQIPNFNSLNPNQIPSDTLQVWKVEPETGILAFEQLAPAGGIFPRQFSLNKKGTLAAIGLQLDSRVVIIERNVEDGKFGKFVAEIDVPGQITSVIWDD